MELPKVVVGSCHEDLVNHFYYISGDLKPVGSKYPCCPAFLSWSLDTNAQVIIVGEIIMIVLQSVSKKPGQWQQTKTLALRIRNLLIYRVDQKKIITFTNKNFRHFVFRNY